MEMAQCLVSQVHGETPSILSPPTRLQTWGHALPLESSALLLSSQTLRFHSSHQHEAVAWEAVIRRGVASAGGLSPQSIT